MRHTSLATFVVTLVLLAAAWIYLYPKWELFWVVDGCLDSGGAWNYEQEVCEYCEEPACMSPVGRCNYFGGKWDSETDVCIGAIGDPWPPPGGFNPEGD